MADEPEVLPSSSSPSSTPNLPEETLLKSQVCISHSEFPIFNNNFQFEIFFLMEEKRRILWINAGKVFDCLSYSEIVVCVMGICAYRIQN